MSDAADGTEQIRQWVSNTTASTIVAITASFDPGVLRFLDAKCGNFEYMSLNKIRLRKEMSDVVKCLVEGKSSRDTILRLDI